MNQNTPRVKLFLALTILLSCIGCDQATKSIATHTLHDEPPRSYLADTIRLDFELNRGGFLSVGSNLPDHVRRWIFVGFNACVMLGLVAFLFLKRNMPTALFVSLVFVLAGGIGNLIDRVYNDGLVTDFINVGIGQVRTGVFNVADMAITFGAVAVIWLTFRLDEHEQNHGSDETEAGQTPAERH